MRGAADAGVEVLTIYAFSSENWRRSDDEVADLTALMRFYLERELKTLEKEGVRLRLIGEPAAFGEELAERLERAIERTAGNTRLTLNIALNYGSRARDRRRRETAGGPCQGRRDRPGRNSTSMRWARACRPPTCPTSTSSFVLRAKSG